MKYLKRTINFNSKQSSKVLIEYFAVSDNDTVQVRHFTQEGEKSNFEITTYSSKVNHELKDAEEILEQEFVSAIQKASDIIKARIYESH